MADSLGGCSTVRGQPWKLNCNSMLIIWSLNPIGRDLQSTAKHQVRILLSLKIEFLFWSMDLQLWNIWPWYLAGVTLKAFKEHRFGCVIIYLSGRIVALLLRTCYQMRMCWLTGLLSHQPLLQSLSLLLLQLHRPLRADVLRHQIHFELPVFRFVAITDRIYD